MNGFVKRLVTLNESKGANNYSIGFVKAYCQNGSTNLDFTLPSGFSLTDKTLFLGNGENFLSLHLAKNLDVSLQIDNALIVAIFCADNLLFFGSSGKIVSKSEILDYHKAFLEQAIFQEPKGEQDFCVYDDEAIAQENYFEFGDDGGEKSSGYFDAQVKEQDKMRQENKKRCENQRENDANFIAFEKKEQKCELKNLVENELKKNPPFLDIKSVLPLGDFCKVSKDNKEYILGKICVLSNVYFALGVFDNKNSTPKNFLGLSFFIPSSFFSFDNLGYHFLFYCQKDEKLIIPKNCFL